MEDIEQIIRNYLPDVMHMSLGTCVNNKPWVCEVHYVYDKDLNLYFISKPSRRHSQEIALNPQVSGNIVAQHAVGEKPRGVYFEGRAEMLGNIDEAATPFTDYVERFGDSQFLHEANQEDGHKFYKISVADFYVFDARESTPSKKYHLSWKNNL